MRCGLNHTPGGAGGADTPPLTRIGNQIVVTAVGAAGTGKAVGEGAAFEVATEFALGQCRGVTTQSVMVQRQPGGEVGLYQAVEYGAFGLASVIYGRRTARSGGNGGHGHPNRGVGRRTVCPYSLCVHPARRLLYRACPMHRAPLGNSPEKRITPAGKPPPRSSQTPLPWFPCPSQGRLSRRCLALPQNRARPA